MVSGTEAVFAWEAVVALAAVPKRDPVNEDALTVPVIGSPWNPNLLVDGK